MSNQQQYPQGPQQPGQGQQPWQGQPTPPVKPKKRQHSVLMAFSDLFKCTASSKADGRPDWETLNIRVSPDGKDSRNEGAE